MKPTLRLPSLRILTGALLGLVALPLGFAMVARATPQAGVPHVPLRWRHTALLRTLPVSRRPLVRLLPAEAQWLSEGPPGVRSPMPHAIWLEARSASSGAPEGSPAEVRIHGRKLVGVVAHATRDGDGTTMWITLDRHMARHELVRQRREQSRSAIETVSLELPLGAALSIPARAVIDSGRRDWVWVATPKGPQPRAIELGPRAQDYYVVAGGLMPGMRVVIDPRFLSAAKLPQNLANVPDPEARRPDPWGPLPN